MPVHPLEERKLPPNSATRFGAMRSSGINENHPECNSHCGVDLYYWKRDDPAYPRGCSNPARNIGRGRAVFAVADGKVVAARDSNAAAGKFVWIDHSGFRSHYVHLDSFSVRTGQKVAQGQQIGTLGRTGIKCDPAHLHFALSRSNRYYDPVPSLRSWPMVGAVAGGSAGLIAAAMLLYWFKTRG